MPSAYDVSAAGFERQRALPDEVVRSIRGAILTAVGLTNRPRLLDLGAGTGRIGWPFVAAGDDYVAADLSGGMLRVFADRLPRGKRAMLVQADGCTLPFAAATFDAVLLIAVFGDLANGRPLVDDACRVLRPRGTMIIGRTAMPDDGIDEILKQRLDILLEKWVPRAWRRNGRHDVASYLSSIARATTELVVASWPVERTPRAFLERHARGARFSRLPLAVRKDALRSLADWVQTEFGALDSVFAETHRFEVQLFRFADG